MLLTLILLVLVITTVVVVKRNKKAAEQPQVKTIVEVPTMKASKKPATTKQVAKAENGEAKPKRVKKQK